MSRILGVVFMILLCVGYGFAMSRQIPTTSQNTIQNKVSTSNQYQPTDKNIEPPPFKVIITPPPKNDPERSTYDADKSDKAAMEIWTIRTAVGTAIILVFQLGVFYWQGRQLKRTVDTMRNADRPYIFAKVRWKRENRKEGDLPPYDIRCTIKNHGRTPGVITFADCKLMDIGSSNFTLSKDGKVRARGPLESEYTITMWPSGAPPKNELWNGKLVCYGLIRYTSIFRTEHVTEFHHVFDSPLIGFCESENQERNCRT